jgi:PPOX class probable F420-dependent enzyme
LTATLDPTTGAGMRALERLKLEKIAWLTTVAPDGQPQASAIWFLWDEPANEILLFRHKRAFRNANLEDNAKVAFNLHTDAGGGDYLSMEGTARFVRDEPIASSNPAYQDKYLSMIEGYGWDTAYFDREYPVAIRITPTRWRVG